MHLLLHTLPPPTAVATAVLPIAALMVPAVELTVAALPPTSARQEIQLVLVVVLVAVVATGEAAAVGAVLLVVVVVVVRTVVRTVVAAVGWQGGVLQTVVFECPSSVHMSGIRYTELIIALWVGG
jgi:hypothetical protein